YRVAACPLCSARFPSLCLTTGKKKSRRCSSTYRVRRREREGSAGRAWDGGDAGRTGDAGLACDGGGAGKERDRTVQQADSKVPARGCESNRVRAPLREVEVGASVRAGRRLPQANGAVQRPGHDPIPGRVEGNPQHILAVAGEGSFLFGR